MYRMYILLYIVRTCPFCTLLSPLPSYPVFCHGTAHWPVDNIYRMLRSRGSTLRSHSKPLGRSDSKKVQDHNVMTARCLILCVLAAAKACWWVLEQPSTSIMELHPTFQKVLHMLNVHKLSMNMQDFGGETQKATLLYSRVLALSNKIRVFAK